MHAAEPVRVVEPKVELIVDETPFVLADAATLGIPIFQKPIVPPKIVLSTFPKVHFSQASTVPLTC